jgi:serine/threonine protein phosphatase PrpC
MSSTVQSVSFVSSDDSYGKHARLVSFGNGTSKKEQICLRQDPLNLFPRQISTTKIFQHGQDGRATLFNKTTQTNITALADGHGLGGEIWMRYSLLMLPTAIIEIIQSIKEIISTYSEEDQQLQISSIMDKTFKDVNRYLSTTCSYTKNLKNGGTTMTVSVKFPHPTKIGAICSITSNVGDSPLVKIDRNGVSTLTEEMNAENEYAYGRYVKETIEKGYTPLPAILGRFNHTKYRVRKDIVDAQGRPEKIKIFNYTFDSETGDVKVKPNKVQLKRFYEGSEVQNLKKNYKYSIDLGGPQSRSVRDSFLKQLDKARKEPECPYPHQNWGSTLDGTTQTVSAFGDTKIHNGQVMPVHTHFEVLESTEPTQIIEVMGSDGFFDILTPEEIQECVLSDELDIEVKCRKLWDKMISIAKCDPIFKSSFKVNKPTWDDVSIYIQIIDLPGVIEKPVKSPEIPEWIDPSDSEDSDSEDSDSVTSVDEQSLIEPQTIHQDTLEENLETFDIIGSQNYILLVGLLSIMLFFKVK